DQPAPRLFRDGDPGLLHHRRVELPRHQRRVALGRIRVKAARFYRRTRHGAFEHLQARVGGAIPIIQRDEAVGEILRVIYRGPGRDNQGPTHDHGAAAHLPHPHWAIRYPAVIAAGSRLVHAGHPTCLQATLRRDGVGKRPFRGRAQVTGLTAGELHLQTFGRKETFVARHQDIHPTKRSDWLNNHSLYHWADLHPSACVTTTPITTPPAFTKPHPPQRPSPRSPAEHAEDKGIGAALRAHFWGCLHGKWACVRVSAAVSLDAGGHHLAQPER